MFVRKNAFSPFRLCQMFHVAKGSLAKHCRLNFPLDYFRYNQRYLDFTQLLYYISPFHQNTILDYQDFDLAMS